MWGRSDRDLFLNGYTLSVWNDKKKLEIVAIFVQPCGSISATEFYN